MINTFNNTTGVIATVVNNTSASNTETNSFKIPNSVKIKSITILFENGNNYKTTANVFIGGGSSAITTAKSIFPSVYEDGTSTSRGITGDGHLPSVPVNIPVARGEWLHCSTYNDSTMILSNVTFIIVYEHTGGSE